MRLIINIFTLKFGVIQRCYITYKYYITYFHCNKLLAVHRKLKMSIVKM